MEKPAEKEIPGITKEIKVSKEELLERVRNLEHSIEKSFRVDIRREVTEVKVCFDKSEMMILQAGLHKLIKDSSHPGDMQYYLDLDKKINSFSEHMKEG